MTVAEAPEEAVIRCARLVAMWRRAATLDCLSSEHRMMWSLAADDLERTIKGWDPDIAAAEFKARLGL